MIGGSAGVDTPSGLVKENRGSLRILNRDALTRGIEYSLLIYIFTQPFVRHTATIQAISLSIALCLWLIKIFYFRDYEFERTGVSIFLIIYTFIVILSILFGIERLTGIRAFKSDIAKQLILYAIVINEIKTIGQIKRILYAMVFSISLLILASLCEYITVAGAYDGFYQYVYKTTNRGTIISNFAELSIFYYVVSVLLFFVERSKSLRIAIGISILLQILFISFSGCRTALITVAFVSTLFPLMLKRYKAVLSFLLGLIILLYLVHASNPQMNYKREYLEVFSLSTYLKFELQNDGLGGRMPTWRAAYEMWKQKPILGHGYGWKKFAKVWEEKGYVGLLPNPHNLFLSLLFESGVLGLISFVLFIVVVFMSLYNNYRRAVSNDHKLLLLGILILLGSTIVSSFSVSTWAGTHGKLMMVMIGLGLCKLEDRFFRI